MVPAPPVFSDDDQRTVDAVIEEKRRKALVDPAKQAEKAVKTAKADEHTEQQTPAAGDASLLATPVAESPGGLGGVAEEADQQGAFNPETGEINWDCPCLGGMANGPCGEEFKSAFSCFVYSKEEPKGMDCIEKFQCV
jgi:mitochondrial intermembrane space import and assembly protein 40